MPEHYTDKIIAKYLDAARKEAREWADPIECAAHFIALYRLATERPVDFKARFDWTMAL